MGNEWVRHLGLALGVGGILVAGAVVVNPSEETEAEAVVFRDTVDQRRAVRDATLGDAKTKNAVSRSGEADGEADDPTTPEQARQRRAYVSTQRSTRAPQVESQVATAGDVVTKVRTARTRYEAAGGCYTLASKNGDPIADDFHFQATDLGIYLLYRADRTFLSATATGVTNAPSPSPAGEWVVRRAGKRLFTLTSGNRALTLTEGNLSTGPTGTPFRLVERSGCTPYPEAETNVTGSPFRGKTAFQEVTGYADAHTHLMAYEFLGGAHCGRPWHRYGVAYALQDCADHMTGVNPLESVLSGRPSHDPTGWPTFKDWPAPDSLTHEGTYWKWLERAWLGGQRLFVNLLVENNQLCRLYPFKRDLKDVTCDDMDTMEREAKATYALQDYIDAQYGGPGQGFFRIVKNPFEARRVINDGKLAVILGIETSIPFGCTMKLDVPACSPEQIDAQLAKVHGWGVRQMELVNKFDNALSGVAGDEGAVGVAVNSANFLETGSYWNMLHCAPADGESADKTQLTSVPIDAQQQDALFGAIATIAGLNALPALPLYGPPQHCNQRGLTTLGKHLINRLAQRKMMFDPDHMSWKARNAALDQVEALGYSGILSSHSWSTPDAYPRIYALGGFVAPYAGDSAGFVEKWRRHLTWADSRYYFGMGFGADINGLGAQGDPRGAGAPDPVTYPFTGLGGVTVDRNHAGERTWDINTDGVAHYGLYPDWIRDVQHVAGAGDGPKIAADLARGAEAYLQTWERAQGIKPDSCRNPSLQRSPRAFTRAVRAGMRTTDVLRAVGQPYRRLGATYTYCTTQGRAKVRFGTAGKVRKVVRIR
ncbi:MAG: hypothetical protein V9G04_12480 [Nocardioides sp.]|jgi:hypothetical protein